MNSQVLEPPLPHFSKMKLHDVISIMALLVCAFGWWNAETKGNSALAATVTELGETVKKIQANQEKLTDKVQDLDTKGTQHSQADIRQQNERNNEQDRRINEQAAQLAQLVPDVREIKARINFVADLLDERTKGHK